jgi:hypothetical protein
MRQCRAIVASTTIKRDRGTPDNIGKVRKKFAMNQLSKQSSIVMKLLYNFRDLYGKFIARFVQVVTIVTKTMVYCHEIAIQFCDLYSKCVARFVRVVASAMKTGYIATKLLYNFRDLYGKFVARFVRVVASVTKIGYISMQFFLICIASLSQDFYGASKLRRQQFI